MAVDSKFNQGDDNMILIKPKKSVYATRGIDCAGIEQAIFGIKNSPSTGRLNNLRAVLNDTFTDIKCKEVLYTKNTDKVFFGMCVMPIINYQDVNKILIDNDISNVDKQYYLEFDSKLFEIGLNTQELTAILLHEIGHIVINMEKQLEELVNAICMYMSVNRETLDLSKTRRCKELLAFGIANGLRNIGSLFIDDEVGADSFAVQLGYGNELQSALKKIVRKAPALNKDVSNKLLILQWTLRLYKNLKLRRIPAIRTLQKAYAIDGSELEKREINKCIRTLHTLDEDDLVNEAVVLHEKFELSIFRKMKQKGIRGIEDDLYEYTLRVKSVDERDEALIILRDINSRLAILDDYLTDKNLSDAERDRWLDVRKKYLMLREDLSKKTTYDDKYYGLFVKTPVVKSRYEF